MITPLYAAIIGILFLVLTVRVIRYRRSNQIGLGDGGDKGLLKRSRAHANCAEFAPLGLLLMFLVEETGSQAWVVHAIGILLVVGRIAHGYGFSASPPVMSLRVAGTLMTLTSFVLSILVLVIYSFTSFQPA